MIIDKLNAMNLTSLCPKVSIVIPVYNTSRYLKECVLSAMNQTYRNLEIICIDDCSTDNSLDILKELQKDDRRISIFELACNSGPGYARNLGLKKISGKYVYFLDSDDYIELDTISYLFKQIEKEKLDVLIFNGLSFSDNTAMNLNSEYLYFSIPTNTFSKNKVKYKYYDCIADCHSPCMKMYRTPFIRENDISFPVSVYGEDVEFWLKCLLNVERINYLDYFGYHRRYRNGSIMTSNSLKNIKDRIDNFDTLLHISAENICLYNYIAGKYIPFIRYKAYLTKNDDLINYTESVIKMLIEKYDKLGS